MYSNMKFFKANTSLVTYLMPVASRAYAKLKLLNTISSFLDSTTLLKIYKATILPILDYGCILWESCSKKNSDFLERLQNKELGLS